MKALNNTIQIPWTIVIKDRLVVYPDSRWSKRPFSISIFSVTVSDFPSSLVLQFEIIGFSLFIKWYREGELAKHIRGQLIEQTK